ncbi:MAG: hypothetical protein LC122_14180 [Chitinophagales bacterium]|nr:hypothetical protein [Chitinophagales bacterium]
MQDNAIAFVWSFTDIVQEVPYRIERKLSGRNNYKLTCSCPYFVNRRKTCKHITMFNNLKDCGLLGYDKRFTVTDFGKEIYNL